MWEHLGHGARGGSLRSCLQGGILREGLGGRGAPQHSSRIHGLHLEAVRPCCHALQYTIGSSFDDV